MAAALQLEYGDADLLCYGAAETGNDLRDAQRQFIAELSQRLEAALSGPARLLFSGPSLGLLARRFADAGHQCTWLHQYKGNAHESAPGSIMPGKEPGKEGIKESSTDFGQWQDSEPLDAIVMEGTIHYLGQLGYLQNARRLLSEGGTLLLAGEYLKDDARIDYSDLATLDSCRQLAARLGYVALAEDDFTAAAAASLERLQELTTKHRASLAERLGGDSRLEAAQDRLRAAAQEFATGRRCLRLLAWQCRTHAEGEYAAAEYGAIDTFAPVEIAALFAASFDKAFDASLWHWKYALNQGRCVVARSRPGGPIVAHYGGSPRRIDYFGITATAIQVCDVMVEPEHRRLYGKNSLFFKTAATFLEREIGYSVGHLLGFGFPNQKAMNIATRLGLYEKTDDLVELCFDGPGTGDVRGSLVPLDLADAGQARGLDGLWEAMRKDFINGIIGRRDAEYFDYRYQRHPASAIYQCRRLLREDGSLLAVAVMKPEGEYRLLLDLVCPLAEINDALALLRHAAAAEPDFRGLKFWITHGWLEHLPTTSAIVNDLGIDIPCNSWTAGPAADRLLGAWWLTAGDMDFM